MPEQYRGPWADQWVTVSPEVLKRINMNRRQIRKQDPFPGPDVPRDIALRYKGSRWNYRTRNVGPRPAGPYDAEAVSKLFLEV